MSCHALLAKAGAKRAPHLPQQVLLRRAQHAQVGHAHAARLVCCCQQPPAGQHLPQTRSSPLRPCKHSSHHTYLLVHLLIGTVLPVPETKLPDLHHMLCPRLGTI